MPGIPGEGRETAASKVDLRVHRDFVRHVGSVIAGQAMLSCYNYGQSPIVNVYQTPGRDDLIRMPQLAVTPYGVLEVTEDGVVYVKLPDGQRGYVNRVTEDPEQAMEFVNRLIHLAHENRRELALAGNEDMEGSRRRDHTIPGAVGHMIMLYDDLLKQLETEHFRQRDRSQSRRPAGGRPV